MFLSTCVILKLRHTGQGHSPKILDRRVAWGAKVKV